VRLWVDRQLLVDEWHEQVSVSKYNATITLKPEQLYDICLEYYYQNATEALVELQWSSRLLRRRSFPKPNWSQTIG
jgi:hypothetical protein